MSLVWNKDRERYENASCKPCPRCNGFGAISSDKGGPCDMCRGYGRVMMSSVGSGWYRPMYTRKNDWSQARIW